MTYRGFAVLYNSLPLIVQLFSGKIRLKLLARLLLNPSSQVYLRQLEMDLIVSSNPVLLELNKLSEMQLISTVKEEEKKIKKYIANTSHPLYFSLRLIIRRVFYKLGELDVVFLTGDLAEGKEAPLIDLVMVGEYTKDFLFKLLERVEKLLNKKIRIAIYSKNAFSLELIEGIQFVSIYKSEMAG